MSRARTTLGALMVAAGAMISPWPASARTVLTVSQQFRAFRPAQATIHAGDTIVIVNDDVFVHQIYIASPEMTFESNEQPPGANISITFPTSGTYHLRCHIHPMMQMTVVVLPKPGS